MMKLNHKDPNLLVVNEPLNLSDIHLFFDKVTEKYFPALAFTYKTHGGNYYVAYLYNFNDEVMCMSPDKPFNVNDRYLYCGKIFSSAQIVDDYSINYDALILDFSKAQKANYFNRQVEFNWLEISDTLDIENEIEISCKDSVLIHERKISTDNDHIKVSNDIIDPTDSACVRIYSSHCDFKSYTHIGFLCVDARRASELKVLFDVAIDFVTKLNTSQIKKRGSTISKKYSDVLRALFLNDINYAFSDNPLNLEASIDNIAKVNVLKSDMIKKINENFSESRVDIPLSELSNSSSANNQGKQVMTTQQTTVVKTKEALATAVTQNKEAALIVAKIQSGNVALQVITNRIADIIPEQYKEVFLAYSQTAIGKLLIANLLATLQSQFANNKKAEFIAEGAIISSMNELANTLPLQKMVIELFSGISVPEIAQS